MPYRMNPVIVTSYSTGGSADGPVAEDEFEFVSFDDAPITDAEDAARIAVEQDTQEADTVPTETLTLNYEKIEWTYDDNNHKDWIDLVSM